jgi:hypothetical protein
LDHSFAPQVSSAGNSLLTLTDLGGTDRVSAIVRGTDFTIPATSCFAPISAHFTGTAVPATLTTLRSGVPSNALWAAYRVGDAAWQSLAGTLGQYAFTASTAAGGRYSVAVACDAANVAVLELTTSETMAPSIQCPNTASTYLVQGNLQNLPSNHCVRGSLGDQGFASCYTQNYAAYVRAATHDLIATIHPLVGGQGAIVPDALRLVRDLVVSGPATIPLDLAGAVSATPGVVQVTPSFTAGSVVFRSANHARTLLGYGGLNATQFSYGGVPFASQRTGDIHELSVSRLEETRRVFFRTPADHAIDFSSAMAFTTATVTTATTTSHRRVTLAAERLPSIDGYELLLQSFNPANEADPFRRWSVFVSTGWLDASSMGSPFAHTTPDLGAAPGFDVNLGLHAEPTAQTSYTLNAHAGSGTMTTLLEVLADRYGAVSHGFPLRSASRTGVVVP